MKGMIYPTAAAVLIMGTLPQSALTAVCAGEPEISAKGAVVISADTGEVIYSFNENEKLPMASTTKIMTALLCLESGGLYEEFIVDSDAIKVEGSSMGLQEGDVVTKYALCCGMLLPSGNDAANAAAVKLAGSIPDFAEMMNDRARQIGMSRTYFVTPSGLEGEGHGSSAYDMALLAREALRNELFRSICSCRKIQTEFGMPPYKRWLTNTNKLLGMYEGVYGVKTGFTDEAGRCLVTACERDGKDLICVTLNDRRDWEDHMAMYDYCFGETGLLEPELPADIELELAGAESERIPVDTGGRNFSITVRGASEEELEYTVISPPFIYAPVNKGDELASLAVSYKGREIERLPLYASADAEILCPEEEPDEGHGIISGIIKLLGKIIS